MSNQSNGLRFDVYERVHLPDDVAAIDELEEIELVPRIQVIDQGDQAVLKGQLLLSGVYRGQNAIAGPLTLEHWIPVEISLPMNRVSRLDDISIEIDNFDVDLISARTLNVTGVLSLRGILVDPVEEQSAQPWEEEPFTASHEREAGFQQEGDDNGIQTVQTYGVGSYGNVDETADGEASQIWFQQQQQLREQQEAQLWAQQQQQQDQEQLREQQEAQFWAQQQQQETAQQNFQDRQQQEWNQNDITPPSFQAEQNEQGYIAGEQAKAWTEDGQREITIASQQGGSDSWLQWSALAGSGQNNVDNQQTVQSQEELASVAQPWTTDAANASYVQQEVVRPEDENVFPSADEAATDMYAAESEEDTGIRQELEESSEDVGEAQQEQDARRQQEVQIAFASKSPSGSGEERPDVGFRAILQSSQREQAAREAAEQFNQEQQAQQEGSRTVAVEEEIEWKKLFLSKAEGNEFRKIRMCIVQKEETLEQIAMRYSMNPREILNHNGLHESAIEEGQLLYIP
ncbi:LysM peptidoglycan-binding domain-containing protein [Paenibacillus agaridevorans]|uniref:LysM peptidoglycan-binding domain-containing protein n=1 Tax=Paenibacillus agaridevorans TaxID=171404 RepID=UPI001BE45D73|nr:LysM peptidoglycan-binding domain-containing protein [Paenibacillus agaridevorans]